MEGTVASNKKLVGTVASNKKLVGTLSSGGTLVGGAVAVFGKDGTTPHIGDNLNWWIGEEDTGVYSKGDPGVYVGAEEPTDPSVIVWINPDGEGFDPSAVSPASIATISLPASAWVGSGNLYSQVVNVPGATESSQVDLTPSVEQLAIFYDKSIAFVAENEDGVVTVYAIGQKPENDYTIQATITEVRV